VFIGKPPDLASRNAWRRTHQDFAGRRKLLSLLFCVLLIVFLPGRPLLLVILLL